MLDPNQAVVRLLIFSTSEIFKINFIPGNFEWVNTTVDKSTFFNSRATVGVDFDGSILYVARHDAQNCPLIGNIATVARLSMEPGKASYMMCYNATYFYEIPLSASSNFGLYKEAKEMGWIETNITHVHLLPGLRGWNDNVNYVTNGRKQMSNWTMHGKV